MGDDNVHITPTQIDPDGRGQADRTAGGDRSDLGEIIGSGRDTCKGGKQWIMEGHCSAWPGW
jgi:hypothetical protein